MLVLALSDLHLGRGKFLKNGQPNILEDFVEDERFEEFVTYHCTEKFAEAPVHLILAGDILNLIQIDIDGVFDHIIDEERTIRALELIARGHPAFFQVLGRFARSVGKRLTYVIGNHDAAAWGGSNGYAAGYYSYKWAEVLSADAYEAFEEAAAQKPDAEAAILDAHTGARFRREILAVGGSRPAAESFAAFRGRAPRMDALLRHSGMTLDR